VQHIPGEALLGRRGLHIPGYTRHYLPKSKSLTVVDQAKQLPVITKTSRIMQIFTECLGHGFLRLAFNQRISVLCYVVLIGKKSAVVSPTDLQIQQLGFPGMPTIGIRGEIKPCTKLDDAKAWLYGERHKTSSVRQNLLRVALSRNIPTENNRVFPGCSIGGQNYDNRGTLGVIVKKEDGSLLGTTAAHVVHPLPIPDMIDLETTPMPVPPPFEPYGVVCPGNADVRKSMDTTIDHNPEMTLETFRRRDNLIGNSSFLAIGADEDKFRQDLCVFGFKEGMQVDTGLQMTHHMADCLGIEAPEEKEFRLSPNFATPIPGTTWAKFGATTGWTKGLCISSKYELFLRSSTIGINDDKYINADNIVKAKVFVFEGVDGMTFAVDGDSGGGIFTETFPIIADNDLRDLVCEMICGGMVVSLFEPEDAAVPDQVFVVPGDRLERQLVKALGEKPSVV
jgi:hypothetical protein